jgi:hypothetical protein
VFLAGSSIKKKREREREKIKKRENLGADYNVLGKNTT